MESNQRDSSESEPYNLTGIEIQILDLLATGISLKEIERRFNHRSGWVKDKLSHTIYKKLGVHNRYDAVIAAQTKGVIKQPDISMHEALNIGRQAYKIALYQTSMTAEELVTTTRYRTLIPYMEGQISNLDRTRSLAGLAFTVRTHGQTFAELGKRAQALSPEIYGRIGLAAEAVSDKLIILGTGYEAEFRSVSGEQDT